MKKNLKRILGIVLSLAMVVAMMPNQVAYASNRESVESIEEFTVQKEDGEYLCNFQVSEDQLSFVLEMTKVDTNETTTVVFDQGISYTYEEEELVDQVDYNDSIEVAGDFRGRAYNGVVKCVVPTLGGNNLWYQMGSSGSDVGYMKIGCDWSYRLKSDISGSCATFRDSILNSNALFYSTGLSAAGATAMFVAILLAGPTGGISIAAAYGILGSSAVALVNACTQEQRAHDAYEVIKQYGTRI